MFIEHNRKRLATMRSLEELRDFAFEEGLPGSLLQREGLNIDNWVTTSATFASSSSRSLEYHPLPLTKDKFQMVYYSRVF